ncbi:MAG: phage N-6-adenine-methyltransferase [Nanoarchaeota archaeon]
MSDKMQVHFSSASDEWETPIHVFNQLNEEFQFDLDAAATDQNFKCKNYFTKENDALSKNWSQYGPNVFCNPPYGRLIGKFVAKAFREAENCCTVILLIPARVDTSYFYEFCSKGEIRFIRGRLKFVNRSLPSWKEDGNFLISPAPFPSCVVIFRRINIPSTKWIKF